MNSPTYRGCLVAEEWHNFQVFAKWFHENYKPEYMQNWHLDKDILVKGNKIYSPETCCFIPVEINLLLGKSKSKRGEYPIGVIKTKNRYIAVIGHEKRKIHIGSFLTINEAFIAYKNFKEKCIKEVADKYKDQITAKTYQALYNYKVEITD